MSSRPATPRRSAKPSAPRARPPAPARTRARAKPASPAKATRPAIAAASDALRAWGEKTIEDGVEQVERQRERLRRTGAIDDAGRRVVDLPADMKPGSRTDV